MTHVFIMTLCYLFMLIVHMLLFYFMAQANHAHQLQLMQMHEQLLLAQMEGYEKSSAMHGRRAMISAIITWL